MRSLMCLCLLLIGLNACHYRVIQQGNVIKQDKLEQIKVGDSRFRVETMLGSPAVVDGLHPRQVYYIEQFDDEANDVSFIRRVEIIYDKALRVKSINKLGFEATQQEDK